MAREEERGKGGREESSATILRIGYKTMLQAERAKYLFCTPLVTF